MDMKGSIAAIKDAITKSTAERTSPEVISAAYAVVYLIGGVLLASARLLGAAGPFGMAAVAASGAGLNGVAALIGAAIGYIISCGLAGSIRYLAAIVLVYTISFAFQDTKLASKSVFAPATAAVSALSTGILSSFTSVFTQAPAAAVVLIETVFSFGGCWFFREAMSGRERTTESEELRYAGSVLITAAVLLMAVSQIEIFGAISLGRLVAVLIVMTCTLRCGIMTGCTIGTAFGIAMDLTECRFTQWPMPLPGCCRACSTATADCCFYYRLSLPMPPRSHVRGRSGRRQARCSRCSRHLSYSFCCPLDF